VGGELVGVLEVARRVVGDLGPQLVEHRLPLLLVWPSSSVAVDMIMSRYLSGPR